jgi:hypothetical protein
MKRVLSIERAVKIPNSYIIRTGDLNLPGWDRKTTP